MPERTLYSAAWVLPIAGPPLADAGVLVDAAGRIEAVAPAAAFAGYEGASVALGNAALLPGLVNVHAHPELTAFRGLLEDLDFADWIVTLMRTKRAAAPSADEWRDAARWACIEAMAAGITTTGATEDSGASLDALLESGLRGIVYREVFGPDPRDADAAFAGLRDRIEDMQQNTNDRVAAGVSPHAPYTVSDHLFERVALFARDAGLPLAVHTAESAAEHALVTQGSGVFADGLRRRGIDTPVRGASTIAVLDRTGVLDARPLLIHCVRVDGDDIARIRDTGASVAHCPTANARLAHGASPLDALLDAGVTTGFGTDSVASNNRLDLLEEARTAQLLVRSRTGRPDALPPSELLRLATLEGARALGLAARIGSLEPGKAADLCAISLDAPHTVPVHDVEATIVHSARASDVVLAVVDGRAVYRDGVPLMLDAAAARNAVEAFAGRLRAARHRSEDSPVP